MWFLLEPVGTENKFDKNCHLCPLTLFCFPKLGFFGVSYLQHLPIYPLPTWYLLPSFCFSSLYLERINLTIRTLRLKIWSFSVIFANLNRGRWKGECLTQGRESQRAECLDPVVRRQPPGRGSGAWVEGGGSSPRTGTWPCNVRPVRSPTHRDGWAYALRTYLKSASFFWWFSLLSRLLSTCRFISTSIHRTKYKLLLQDSFLYGIT